MDIEDEILPEIEIQEYITIDEAFENEPTFVVFEDDEIQLLLTQLLQGNAKRASTFLQLHKNIIKNPTLKYNQTYLKYVQLQVDTARKDYTELEDFISEREEALKAPSYLLQQNQLNTIAFPFEREDIEEYNKYPILSETSELVLSKKDSSKLLNTDNYKIPVKGALWKSLEYTNLTYVYENEKKKIKKSDIIKWKTSNSSDLYEWIAESIRPSLHLILKNKINELIDLHSIRVKLLQDGYNLDHLNETEYNTLILHLEKLVKEQEHEDKDRNLSNISDVSRKGNGKQSETIDNRIKKYWEIIKDQVKINTHFIQSQQFQKLKDFLTEYITKLQQDAVSVAASIHDMEPYQIAKNLSQGSMSIDDAIEIIKYKVATYYIQTISEYSKKILSVDILSSSDLSNFITELDSVIEKVIKEYERTNKSIKDDESSQFITLYSDIHDLVEGQDTSDYDGSIKITTETVFEEMQTDFNFMNVNLENDTDENNEAIDTIPDNYDELFPIYSSFSFGNKDIFLRILPVLIQIRDASGLPININKVIEDVSTTVNWVERSHELLLNNPDLSTLIARKVCTNNLSTSLKIIEDISNTELRQKIHSEYTIIHKKWEEECKNTLLKCMTYIWLELLDSSVRNNLDFSILQGMISVASSWGPFGIPLEKTTSSGIIIYITEVYAKIYTWMVMDKDVLRDKMLKIAEKEYADKLKIINENWEHVKDKIHKMDKSKEAKYSLIEAVKAIQSKKTVDILPVFVKAYTYLPTLLPSINKGAFKKQASWSQGCCIIPLNDKYEADLDFKNDQKVLYAFKQKLAKNRLLLKPRSVLLHYKKEKEEKIKVATIEKIECENKDQQEEKDIWDIFQEKLWISNEHMTLLKSDINARQGKVLFEQFIFEVYPKNRATQLQKIFEDISDISILSQIIIIITSNLFSQFEKESGEQKKLLEEVLKYIAEMKKCIYILQTQGVGILYNTYVNIAKYIIGKALCLPANIDRNSIILPNGLSTAFYPNILKLNYDSITKWYNSRSMLNPLEVKEFISKMREEQKLKTLQELDKLSVEDMQIIKDLKRFGLTKIVGKKESEAQAQTQNQPTIDEVYEMEGVDEFKYYDNENENEDNNTLGDNNEIHLDID